MKVLDISPETIKKIQDDIEKIGTKKEDSYQCCAVYYAITARNGGWAFCAAGHIVIVCLHPYRCNEIIIFPEISFNGSFKLTVKILKRFSFLGKKITLGRFSIEEYNIFISEISEHLYFDGNIFQDSLMDWVYPVRVLSTEIVSRANGREFQKIRNKVRRAEAHITSNDMLGETASNNLNKVFERWKIRMSSYNDELFSEIQNFYDTVGKIISKNPGLLEGIVFSDRLGEPCGITLWSRIWKDTANLYVNIADPTIVGLSDYQLIITCQQLYNFKINFLNMGGSEKCSLDKYKSKYMPHKTIEIISARITFSDFLSYCKSSCGGH